MQSRASRLAVAVALALTLASCAGPSIEEMGRTAIREKAAEGKDWFTRFTAATDTANRELVASKLEGLGDPPTLTAGTPTGTSTPTTTTAST
ncbi:hypothetical protein B1A87_003110 [Arthrobacter sp. KBS0703]|uniref:hypothetical protein n=1 Tax=Arthrobacter sp. KBS0703 TaxID=1955698 RepID=UPI00098F9F35|nr:hypothetical protein [Arthrobacter sp. KBS0703]TSE15054.1 hypothetical protein B1A87_003110 [Arthrobacter sp. KBS0703]